jgi:hypothetical protein
MVEVLSHDLLPLRQGLELLLATTDGSIICLGSMLETTAEVLIEDTHRKNLWFKSWPGVTKTANDFTFTDLKVKMWQKKEQKNITHA